MLITVKRIESTPDETLSIIYIDGRRECFGLEDEARAVKIDGETRIPAGTYPIKLRTAGNIHPKYQAKFPDIHKGMLWLQDVPGFEWIYFHIGNTDEHTAGCILLAQDARIRSLGAIELRNSTFAYAAFYERVIDAAWMDDLTVEVIDEQNAKD